ncbi:unnamed protein product [Lampetra planeri]
MKRVDDEQQETDARWERWTVSDRAVEDAFIQQWREDGRSIRLGHRSVPQPPTHPPTASLHPSVLSISSPSMLRSSTVSGQSGGSRGSDSGRGSAGMGPPLTVSTGNSTIIIIIDNSSNTIIIIIDNSITMIIIIHNSSNTMIIIIDNSSNTMIIIIDNSSTMIIIIDNSSSSSTNNNITDGVRVLNNPSATMGLSAPPNPAPPPPGPFQPQSSSSN